MGFQLGSDGGSLAHYGHAWILAPLAWLGDIAVSTASLRVRLVRRIYYLDN